MTSLSFIERILLNSDLEQFQEIESKGFPTQDIVELVHDWPRVPSEFKLHTVADAILTHYKNKSEFGKELSEMIGVLKKTSRDTASYRLGKIIDSWIHQQWTSLPCALLSPIDAYSLFPKHALAPPSIPIPKIPFHTVFRIWVQNREKILERPLKWEGVLDAFSSLLDHIPQPRNISVIGFGDGKELLLLRKKWPATTIYGFEKKQKQPISFDPAAHVTVYYESTPKTYRHGDDAVEFILIRHPDSKNFFWSKILFKALDALSFDGILLMTFYSEGEMLALKKTFHETSSSQFIWSDLVNPFAYNPSFMSVSGTYSFDLFLVSIRRKEGDQSDFLKALTPTMTRSHQEISCEIPSKRKKFTVIEHDNFIVLSLPGSYEQEHQKKQYGQLQNCFKCKKIIDNYFHTSSKITGEKPIIANVLFCTEHAPSTKEQWEIMLHEPSSLWRDEEPVVCKYDLIGQSISSIEIYALLKTKRLDSNCVLY